jgi:hypothetical protein
VKLGEVPLMVSGAHTNASWSMYPPERPPNPTITWLAAHILVCVVTLAMPRTGSDSAWVVRTLKVVVPVMDSDPQMPWKLRR